MSQSQAWVLVVFGLAVYLLPSIIAVMRGSRTGRVVLINVFFGWSLVGWFVALLLALWPKAVQKVVYVPVPYDGLTTEDLLEMGVQNGAPVRRRRRA